MRKVGRWLPAILIAAGAIFLGYRAAPEPGLACAFDPQRPTTYEADAARERYLMALDSAANNALLPGDSYFGNPQLLRGTRANPVPDGRRLPVEVLRGIAWVESQLTMAARSVPFDSVGQSLVSFDCGHGLMQVTSGMSVPLGERDYPSADQLQVATSYPHNIARGAALLASKWNEAPTQRPIVGTDTGRDPRIIENWYYSVWSYNGFTGPGSSQSNHPLSPALPWPRSPNLCNDSQSRTRFPYQELVWGCIASPPTRAGDPLWPAVAASLPDLTLPEFYGAMRVANWSYPYRAMDITTPRPAHASRQPTAVSPGRLLGDPELEVDQTSLLIRTNGRPDEAMATVRIKNIGTGLLSWAVTPSDGFLVVSPTAGSAAGTDLPCRSGDCSTAEITVTVSPSLLPAARADASITISSPTEDRTRTVRVQVLVDFEVAASGVSRAP